MSELGRRLPAVFLLLAGRDPSRTLPGLMDLAEAVGRALLALLFILEAIAKLQAYGAAGRYMAAFGVPVALLPFAVIAELGGGVLIALGCCTRAAALMFAALCVVTAGVFHNNFSDHNQLIHFEKDLALAGAFLILSVRGGGRYSLDSFWRQSRIQRAR